MPPTKDHYFCCVPTSRSPTSTAPGAPSSPPPPARVSPSASSPPRVWPSPRRCRCPTRRPRPSRPAATLSVANAPTIDAVVTGATSALDDAQSTLSDAEAVQADVAATGLPLSIGDATVDTSALQDAVTRLDSRDMLPVLLVPRSARTRRPRPSASRPVSPRSRAASSRRRREGGGGCRGRGAASGGGRGSGRRGRRSAGQGRCRRRARPRQHPDGARAYAQQFMAQKYGWGSDQFSCLSSLWNKESGWNYKAYNNDGGATGIPQSLPGARWRPSAPTGRPTPPRRSSGVSTNRSRLRGSLQRLEPLAGDELVLSLFLCTNAALPRRRGSAAFVSAVPRRRAIAGRFPASRGVQRLSLCIADSVGSARRRSSS